jgi:hypothetical protein
VMQNKYSSPLLAQNWETYKTEYMFFYTSGISLFAGISWWVKRTAKNKEGKLRVWSYLARKGCSSPNQPSCKPLRQFSLPEIMVRRQPVLHFYCIYHQPTCHRLFQKKGISYI